MNRQLILGIVGVLLVVAAYFGMKAIIASKKPRQGKAEKVVNTAFVKKVKNTSVPVTIIESGRLVAKQKMNLFAEVQGVMESTGKEFKPGSRFQKGEVLLRIRNNDYYANLQAQKSVLQNLVTSILPDLRLDYPEAYPKWDSYLKNFDMGKSVPELPEPSSEKEKFFITGKNIYTTYYNTKNQELVYAKYQIRAPFSGVLTETLVNPGTVIRPGQRLGEFINTQVYELAVAINQSMITSISVGNEVMVTLPDNANTKWTGRIVRINGKVDPTTQTVQAFVELKGSDLKDGMYLEAHIPGKAKENAFEIQRALLVDEKGVFVVSDSLLSLQSVDVLHKNQKSVIVSGLPDNSWVLDRMIPGAYHGMKVSIHKEEKGS